MPGRRRKKERSGKRLLVFEESPVERRPHLSPVHCVHNPVTAACVAVETTSQLAWVSPQFNGIPISDDKRHQARKRPLLHSSAGRQVGAVLEKENSTLGRLRAGCRRGLRRRNYFTLQFVGDTSRSESRSPFERRSEVDGGESGHEDGRNDCSNTDAAGRQLSSRRKSTDHGSRPLLDSSDCTNDHSCPAALTSGLPSCSGGQKRSRATSPHPTSLPAAPVVPVEDGIKQIIRKSCSSDILLSPYERSDMSGRSPGVFPEVRGQLPAVALWDCSPPPLHSPGDACSMNSRPGPEDVSLSLSAPPVDSNMHVAGGVSLPSRARPVKLTAVAGTSARRSQRLQEKYAEAVKYLHPATPTGQVRVREEGEFTVLVQDTPENEYGLRLRQRQQHKINRCAEIVRESQDGIFGVPASGVRKLDAGADTCILWEEW